VRDVTHATAIGRFRSTNTLSHTIEDCRYVHHVTFVDACSTVARCARSDGQSDYRPYAPMRFIPPPEYEFEIDGIGIDQRIVPKKPGIPAPPPRDKFHRIT